MFIKITSRGPVIYKQHRVGENGKIFVLYKFRTMVMYAEKVWGFKPAIEEDERITYIGKLLRKTRLDELPQLINVLKGDMSLVGPRPENLYRVKTHEALRGARLAVKPGITGLAQIRSLYDLKPDHKLKYDYLYIQKRSFFLNLYILIKTIPVLLNKTGW
jgi:lipopolysaccharide/colanic/teichoic acid biosynthesis glycosyltransferase